ncbi:LysR family transcriptional regulator [Taklimakanibacter deserti]|uniref:LysR family transcriptional regulator n=1 Tax=Taklimakanibacter deserti TaxID=2267839 RepID=UPI000E64FCAA
MKRSDLAGLTLFAEVVVHGGFRGAAKAIGISPSAVSHGIANLEKRLGVRLLNRTTRSIAPTDAGIGLLARLGPALRDIDAALAGLSDVGDEPAGVLRLTLPQSAADFLLIPHLTSFHERFPGITLDLHVDNSFTDIVAHNFDAGIRLGESLEQDMIAVRIGGDLRSVIVATPGYLASKGIPQSPADLQHHNCIGLRFPRGLYQWELAQDGKEIEVAVEGSLILNDGNLVVEAAKSGLGLAYVFEDRVREDLAAGRLVRVLEDCCPAYPGFFVYYPRQRQMRPALRAFIDFIRQTNRGT